MKGRVKAKHVVASVARVAKEELFITVTTATGAALHLINREGLKDGGGRE